MDWEIKGMRALKVPDWGFDSLSWPGGRSVRARITPLSTMPTAASPAGVTTGKASVKLSSWRDTAA